MKIVIPKQNSPFRATIKKGSGIVMLPMDDNTNLQTIYYEGNLYGALNLYKYTQRIVCAANRAHTKYPTIAMSGVLPENVNQFFVVGECDPENYYLIHFKSETEDIRSEWLS